MSQPPADHPQSQQGDADRTRTYIQVLVIEVVVITMLFWLGRYFG